MDSHVILAEWLNGDNSVKQAKQTRGIQSPLHSQLTAHFTKQWPGFPQPASTQRPKSRFKCYLGLHKNHDIMYTTWICENITLVWYIHWIWKTLRMSPDWCFRIMTIYTIYPAITENLFCFQNNATILPVFVLLNNTKWASYPLPSLPVPGLQSSPVCLWIQPSDCGRKPNNTVWIVSCVGQGKKRILFNVGKSSHFTPNLGNEAGKMSKLAVPKL